MITEKLNDGLVKKEMKKYKVTGNAVINYEVPILADSKEQALQFAKEHVFVMRYTDGTYGIESDLPLFEDLNSCRKNNAYLLDEIDSCHDGSQILTAVESGSIVHYERKNT